MSDTNKRQYKIYPTDLWYSNYRQKENDSISVVQYLNWYGKRSPNKRTAKAFMNTNDAVSWLIIARWKGEWEAVWY